MCGIAGIVHANNSPVSSADLEGMRHGMKHRGPDDEGFFREHGLGLSFVRLSILDLSQDGHQPMISEDGRFVLIYNGEIYNYVELREDLKKLGYTFRSKTDTEVLLKAYMAWGEDMLHMLNGMWAFVIYDKEENTLFGARDRYGIKPFYYSLDEDRLIFCSEIPPILKVLGRKPNPDHGSIFDFLVFNRTDQTEATFFKEVLKLNHGHSFSFKLGRNGGRWSKGFKIKKWYDLKNQVKPNFSCEESFRAMFSSSVGLRLRSDVPVGVCLSGGLDSSSIVSVLLQDYGQKELNTFSAVYGEGMFGDESSYIDLYRDKLDNMHFIYPTSKTLLADIDPFVRAHAEPVPSTSPYAQYKVMELARDQVTVTLDGQGADEQLAGYHYFFGFFFKDLLRQGRLPKLAYEMGAYYSKHRSIFGLKSFLFFFLPAYLRTQLRVREKGYLDTGFYQEHGSKPSIIAGELYGSPSLQDALINHFEYKLEHLLKWEDRNSMWHSIESRVPFLDYRLVEGILSLQSNMIIKDGMTKHILREAMKGTLPEPIRMRRDKVGFGTPQDAWFRSPAFQKYIWNLIGSKSFSERGILDTGKVKGMYRQHLNGEANHAKEIWKWINLENWYRMFID